MTYPSIFIFLSLNVDALPNQRSFVSVIGASGSGKSSVVLAGLIPRLKELGGWEFLPPIRPGDDPIAKLKNVFEIYFPKSKKELQNLNDCLNKEPANLQGLIEKLPEPVRFLLVVDQFEELFTLCSDADKKKQFIKLLSQVPPQSRLSAVINIRADFMVDCLEDSDLTQLIKDPVFMPPLEGASLEAVILKPSKCQGYELEEGLLGEILQDVVDEEAALPLLEFTLKQLWEKRDLERHLLTREGYQAIGGLTGSLNRYANKLYEEFDNQGQEWIKEIFCHLLKIGDGTHDTRKWQSKQNLLAIVKDDEINREAFSEVLEKLIASRLLVTGQENDVSLAHEALIEGWEKLEQWRQKSRKVRELAEMIENAYKAYVEHLGDRKSLLNGFLLEDSHKEWKRLKEMIVSEDILSFCTRSFTVFSFETGTDYRPLDYFLSAHNWEEAEFETYRVMTKVLEVGKRGYLDGEDYAQFPCEDLQKIDYLWCYYSGNHFGFSVQRAIYESLGGIEEEKDEIGKSFVGQIWDRAIEPNEIVPQGYFPKLIFEHLGILGAPVNRHTHRFYSRLRGLFSRMKSCNYSFYPRS